MKFEVHRCTPQKWEKIRGASTYKEAVKIAEVLAKKTTKERFVRFGVYDNRLRAYRGFADAGG